MNQTDLFEMSETIARGEACPACGAEWIDDPGGLSGQLTHADGCTYHRAISR